MKHFKARTRIAIAPRGRFDGKLLDFPYHSITINAMLPHVIIHCEPPHHLVEMKYFGQYRRETRSRIYLPNQNVAHVLLPALTDLACRHTTEKTLEILHLHIG